MQIQINTDNNVSVRESFGDKLETMLAEKLSRFSEHITRLEVHFSDENGPKTGVMDKKCIIEARHAGRAPVAVSAIGDNYELAMKGAIEKLMASLTTIQGKMSTH